MSEGIPAGGDLKGCGAEQYVALAHSLGASLVAEGVEDVETLNALRLLRM